MGIEQVLIKISFELVPEGVDVELGPELVDQYLAVPFAHHLLYFQVFQLAVLVAAAALHYPR